LIDIENHLKEFPNAVMVEKGGRIYGTWVEGNNYKSPKDYYGTYPPSYLRRVYSLIPNRGRVLHLFSGVVEEGHTFDINPDNKPDTIGDAEHLSTYFEPDSFDLVCADPPYTKPDAKIYGYKLPVTYKVFRELYKIVRKGGLVVWLCTRIPMWRKDQWFMRGLISVYVGTNKVFRVAVILERL